MPELTSPPSLLPLFGKAALMSFRKPSGSVLPDTEYSRTGVTFDPAHLAAYNKVCEFRLTDELPITYPHVLTFPMQVKLMTDDGFPFPLIGSVHVNNTITQLRPIRVSEKVDLKVHAENLRSHPKGKQFDMVSEAVIGGEVVWRDVSTYLRRGGSNGSNDSAAPEAREEIAPVPVTAEWRVADDIGRRYAEVSGDHNPIHLYPLTAKLLGFPKQIAHGMWTKSRSLAAYEGQLPQAYTVDVRFKLPVLLPAKLAFGAEDTPGGGSRFEVRDARKGKPHLEGTITPL
jgi:acyl dehydratase